MPHLYTIHDLFYFTRIILYAFVLLLLSFSCIGQQKTIYGYVNGSDGNPIVRCVVRPTNIIQGVHTDDRGYFVLTCDDNRVNSLTFQCMGYEAKEVFINSDTTRVVLIRKVTQLSDVTVSSVKGGRVRRGILGKKKLKPFGICTGEIGDEWAIFLDGDSAKHGLLDHIFIYILSDGIPNSKFRVHVYDIDTNYLPGRDLLDSSVIAHANKGDEWVDIDVSAMQVPIGGGIFVSVEWISGYGNDLRRVRSKIQTAQPPFNGQVISFTESYFKRWSLTYRRNLLKGRPWNFVVGAGSSKKNVLNPMIYGTYTYHQR